jgi:hypothetical protein
MDVKVVNHSRLCQRLGELASAVASLIENAAHAKYTVRISTKRNYVFSPLIVRSPSHMTPTFQTTNSTRIFF